MVHIIVACGYRASEVNPEQRALTNQLLEAVSLGEARLVASGHPVAVRFLSPFVVIFFRARLMANPPWPAQRCTVQLRSSTGHRTPKTDGGCR